MTICFFKYYILPILLCDRLKLDRKYENEPYFYDLSFVNSNYESPLTVQNKFSNRDRSGSYVSNKHSCQKIRPLPSSLRTDLKLSYFYQRYTEAYGIPIVGSNKVSNNAMKRACYVLRFFLADRNDLKEVLYKRNVRIVILATTENLLNVPEYSSLPNSWNFIRGLSPTPNMPLITVSDENLQCSNDKFKLEDLLVHELAYSLLTMNALDAHTKHRLESYYARAKRSVPWSDSFVMADVKEYFASAVEVYLNAKKEQSKFSYEDLRAYDPHLFSLIKDIFTCDNQFLNKCKTTREQEDMQALRIGSKCEQEAVVSSSTTQQPSMTTPATTVSAATRNNEYYMRQQQQQQPTVTTTTAMKLATLQTQTLAKPNSNKLVVHYTTSTSPLTSSTTTTPTTTTTTTRWIQTDCVNLNTMCDVWARKGECARNRQYMSEECPRSCSMCADQTTTTARRRLESTTTKLDLSVFAGLCKDEFTHCPVFALRGDCKLNPHYMLQKCMRSCNLCGDLVEQKDRIQPTSKKPSQMRRPSSGGGGGGSRPTHPSNSEYNDFQNYYHSMIGGDETTTTTTSSAYSATAAASGDHDDDDYNNQQQPQHHDEHQDDHYAERQPGGGGGGGGESNQHGDEINESSSSSCKDLVGHCSQLAERGDCASNEATMRYYCSKSCRFC